MAKRQAYITLKDHKENFASKLPCRLINPANSEMGKVSKQILDRILTSVRDQLPLNIWRNTKAVTDWFNGIDRKEQCVFISFDIVDFYPPITKDLLDKALDFASQHAKISEEDREIISHARKSMLFGQGQEWIKTGVTAYSFPPRKRAPVHKFAREFAHHPRK